MIPFPVFIKFENYFRFFGENHIFFPKGSNPQFFNVGSWFFGMRNPWPSTPRELFEILKKIDFWPNYAIFKVFSGLKIVTFLTKFLAKVFLPRELIFCITYPRPNTPTRFFQENVFFLHFDLLLPNLLFLLVFVVSDLQTTYFNKIYFFLSFFCLFFLMVYFCEWIRKTVIKISAVDQIKKIPMVRGNRHFRVNI